MVYVSVVNLLGESVYKEEEHLIDIHLQSFEGILDRLIGRYPTIRAIGFGLPGEEYDEVVTINDYRSIDGTRFTEYYRNHYGLPVIFENDVNAAVVGYCHKNKIACKAAIVYIYFPDKYNPGAGIYINGDIYRGHTNFAGEIDNIPLGIDWRTIDYKNISESCDGIAKLVISMISILNPQQIIFHGNFITQEHIQTITKNIQRVFADLFIPILVVSDNFNMDFERGLIQCTLELLESKLSLRE